MFTLIDMESSVKYDIVKRAVDAADLVWLLEIGAPDDEYDFEAARIAAAINSGDAVGKIAKIACEVFSKAFSREMPVERFEKLAQEVWAELNKVN